METILANLAGKSRRAALNGKDYLVAPLTLIVPGVLNGSKGSLYYPIEEIGKDPGAWNGIPITVYHPIQNGNHVSARDPDVLSKQQVGHVFRANANGKLTAEGWFDLEAVKRIDNRILEKLEKGEPIELSTGLFTDNEPAPEGAIHNGKDKNGKPFQRSYDYIARNYRPDHLAILPDQKGACSVQDGCGVNVNELCPECAKEGKPNCPT